MIRKRYDYIVNNLRDDILRLGGMVERALEHITTSLETGNITTAGWIIKDDAQIDTLRFTIEERVMILLATQQPVVASDLRLMSAVVAIASELERIGDYASNIGKRIQRMDRHDIQVPLPTNLYEMGTLARTMLHTSLEAFLHQDADLARRLKQEDNRVDELQDQLRAELLELARSNPQSIDVVTNLIDVVHLFERVGDRATNIAERVVYMVTSDTEDLNT